MRDLIERLETLSEASDMDAKQFAEALEKKAKIGDRVLRQDIMNQYTKSYDTILANFYNVPKAEAHGARAENNRWMFKVTGFSRELGSGPPSGKVKVETVIPFRKAEKRFRAKSGTPEKIVEYIAKTLEDYSKTEPNRNV